MAAMATDKNGWGAGKCPSCGSWNTDSNVGGAPEGRSSYDCMDCGHGWDQPPRKNAAKPKSGRAVHEVNTSRRPSAMRSAESEMGMQPGELEGTF
jgi:transposase-like protein